MAATDKLPHERADGTTSYGEYTGRDWRNDYDIATLLERVGLSKISPLAPKDRADAHTLAMILRQRMAWADIELENAS